MAACSNQDTMESAFSCGHFFCVEIHSIQEYETFMVGKNGHESKVFYGFCSDFLKLKIN